MLRVLLAGCALLLGACTPESEPPATPQAQQAVASESARLNALFDEKFEERLQMSPATLTRLARKDRYDEYDDLSEAEQDRQLAWWAETVAELQSTFSYDALDLEAKTSYDLWLYQYEQAREAAQYRRSSYIFTQMSGPQSQVAQFLIRFHKVDSAEDMEAYIARIGGVSDAVRDLLERARLNAQAGVRPPRFAYEGAIRESENLIRGVPFTAVGEDAPLWADARSKVRALQEAGQIDATRAQALLDGAREALLSRFQPTYRELIDWLTQDLDHVPEPAQGVGSLPDGADYYRYRLRQSTTTDLTADEIHELGLAEVARIRAEMEEIREQVGFDGGLQAFFAHVKSDERFLYPNTDAGRQGYLQDSERYLAFIEQRLPDYFGILPQAGLEVRRVEAFREQDGAAQHYSAGAPDGSRPGVYYAHLSDMTAMPKHLMEAVAYHEGVPGHHMQVSIAQESESVPQFRTQARFTVYSEGWALYSELLAKEMGAYQDPYSDFGRLSTEIWRAIRLVLDTGIHARGWSEEAAIAYFKENSAVADGAIVSEVHRYFVSPGQATAYKVGMLKILELRAYAEEALGPRFDIRAFHDTVLGGGPLPLNILDRRVRNWVAAQT